MRLRTPQEIVDFVMKKLGISEQSKLAGLLGIEKSTVNTWHQKKSGSIEMARLWEMAKLCKITLDEVILEEDSSVVRESVSEYSEKAEAREMLCHLAKGLKKRKEKIDKLSKEERTLELAKIEVGVRLIYVPAEADEIMEWLRKEP